jgi:APA family basic amino acid/polyamine antiporter
MAELKKELGLLSVFSIAAGAMISSGLFILPGLAYYISGPAVILAYLLAGILVLPSMFSKTELATAMPKSGGDGSWVWNDRRYFCLVFISF